MVETSAVAAAPRIASAPGAGNFKGFAVIGTMAFLTVVDLFATQAILPPLTAHFGLSLTSLPAWLLWRAYHLAQMPTFGRKLRIFAEWTWGMFFVADITHFRFSKSKEL